MDTQAILNALATWASTQAYSIALGLLALVIGWWLSNFVAGRLAKVLAKTKAIDDTIGPVLCQLVRYAILVVTLVIVLSQFGVATTSILAVLGAAGLAIALALQGTLSNIAAGVMLVWLRPFSIGEFIEADSIAGTVREIGLFATKLNTSNGLFLFVPNSQLWNTSITNFSRLPERRVELRVGIAYDANIAQARTILLGLANRQSQVLSIPAPVVHVETLGDSAVTMLLRFWVPSEIYWDAVFAFREAAKIALDNAGIEIPFNKVDINVYSHIKNSPAADSPPA
ncbi:Small-conductance mechanosensitive channel [hydrothermal vent metagenome]|uniref:Small-conductance mechanosensitive channel n=1 Tax=hydrothermal vent metagenome TaxID=652676 RepID=A0A3B0TIR9_9ZZZZ